MLAPVTRVKYTRIDHHEIDAVPYLGDDHRPVGTLCPDMKLSLKRPGPDVVTAVTRSADLLRGGRGFLLDLVDYAEVRDATALVRALGTWFGHPA
jgi:hypothetical protein